MRKQVAAANWKMNLTSQQAEQLLHDVLQEQITLQPHQHVIFAVPFPYLAMAVNKVSGYEGYEVAAQNCYHKVAGAYTGEVSVDMLYSTGIRNCVVGHSERREYFHETNHDLAEKVSLLLMQQITPLFCCGEPLDIREAGSQNSYVEKQLAESLFHLTPEQVAGVVIAYEPIWAIGTGKTASTEQAQEMHAFIRSVMAGRYGEAVAAEIPVLYGGSVKPSNAKELFSARDVDGGLVGGASLVAQDFIRIIQSLK